MTERERDEYYLLADHFGRLQRRVAEARTRSEVLAVAKTVRDACDDFIGALREAEGQRR